MGPSPSTTLNDIARIVAIADPVRRNYEITYCYYKLSGAFMERTGNCANWCTFAAWASRQAGQSIRGEDLIEAFTRNTFTGWVLAHPIRAMWQSLVRRGLLHGRTRLGRIANAVHSPFDAVERASAAVARGNLKVFEEIAPYFARALASMPFPDDAPELIRSAFRHYGQNTPQSIFMANLEIGFHEQTRLQPEIQEAMESGPVTGEDLKKRALQAIYPGAWDWPAFVRRPLAAALAPLARAYSRHVREATRMVVTDALMTLTLPSTTIALGHEIDREPVRDLANITDPELVSLMERFSQTGVRDWASLDYRMHVIARLFRAFHDHPDLRGCPLRDNELPAG